MRLSAVFVGAVVVIFGGFGWAGGADDAASGGKLVFTARRRVKLDIEKDRWRVVCEPIQWEARKTTIIICDMWDRHWCKSANRRVAEMAVYMNRVVQAARRRGVFVIHAPSGTMDFYEGHPARERAKKAPRAANLPPEIGRWCRWINEEEKKAGYPIDHSDGGCDCEPKCKQKPLWQRQIATIEIAEEADAISDSGVEIWNLLEQRGIQNVILMGVHTNMCVLGRPFGLRNLARYGKNVVLARDLTDTMYNPRMRPFVNHFTGTDLIVEHIEKYVCPTVTSRGITGERAFRFRQDKRKRVVIISAEGEYRAVETMPILADVLERKYGLHCDIVQGSTAREGQERHFIWGLEALEQADAAVLFVRRRAFQAEQMEYFRRYLERGGGLVGLRTASHAFDTRGEVPEGHRDWRSFDAEVLGGNYHGHYGRGVQTTVTIAAGADGDPILKGVEVPFTSNGSLYRSGPLRQGTKALLTGSITGQAPEPVAWKKRYGRSRVFYTSLGHPDDFENPSFQRLIVNAIFWVMGEEVPEVQSNHGW